MIFTAAIFVKAFCIEPSTEDCGFVYDRISNGRGDYLTGIVTKQALAKTMRENTEYENIFILDDESFYEVWTSDIWTKEIEFIKTEKPQVGNACLVDRYQFFARLDFGLNLDVVADDVVKIKTFCLVTTDDQCGFVQEVRGSDGSSKTGVITKKSLASTIANRTRYKDIFIIPDDEYAKVWRTNFWDKDIEFIYRWIDQETPTYSWCPATKYEFISTINLRDPEQNP